MNRLREYPRVKMVRVLWIQGKFILTGRFYEKVGSVCID